MNWQGVGEALSAQAEQASAQLPSPDEFLAQFLRDSASSAVQQRFAAGVEAARSASDTSSAGAAGALLLAELKPLEEVMRPVAFAARAGERQLVDQVVQVLQWAGRARAIWSEPASWESDLEDDSAQASAQAGGPAAQWLQLCGRAGAGGLARPGGQRGAHLAG